MTVVETSTSISPAAKAPHGPVLVVGVEPAVQHLDPQPVERRDRAQRLGDRRTTPVSSRGAALSGLAGVPVVVGAAVRRRRRPRRRARPASPIRGHTTYAWWPLPTSSRDPLPGPLHPARASSSRTTCVAIGDRPAGSSRSVEVSRSPNTVIATVRGIGVAVMTSRCGGVRPLARKASRCSTPNRCCSSTTTSAEVGELHVLLDQRVRADHDARLTGRRVAAAPPPHRRRLRAGEQRHPGRRCRSRRACPPSARSPSIAEIERWCCAASTSVGASSAAWPPASMTASIARSATTVLPEPTSPCSSRCIGRSGASSSASCSPTAPLPRGQLERQPRVERREQAAGTRRTRRRRHRLERSCAAARGSPGARTPRRSAAARPRPRCRPPAAAGARARSASRRPSSPRRSRTSARQRVRGRSRPSRRPARPWSGSSAS